MTMMTYPLKTGPSMLGEDDGKILTTTSVISLHVQAPKHRAMILNKVNGYCSIASDMIMVDMQPPCRELVYVRIQIVYVVQFRLV